MLQKVINELFAGIDKVSAECGYRCSILHFASEYGLLEVAKYLVEFKGANVSEKDCDDLTAFDLAYMNAHFKVAKYLKEKTR